jgi:anthranilate phosphoribosyltransferase
MKKVLERLHENEKLSKEEAKEILKRISSREFSDVQITGFISVFQMRDITLDELQGFREALMDLCLKLDFSEFDTIDMCGTGGDGKNTFNISTLSSFVVAGAGYKVAKHGNYGVSSVSGSSNVLEAMGYKFTNDEKELRDQLRDANITFLHAPLFHHAMAAVGPVRKEMKMKTFFNMLGPLVNPSNPQNQISGVFSRTLARVYQYFFQNQNDKKYAVIYGLDGYDEISLTDDFIVRDNKGKHLYNPEILGLKRVKQSDIFGGNTIEEAADIFRNIIDGKGTHAQNDVVCANAALAIQIMNDDDRSFLECFEEAKESLHGGKAKKSLQLITGY